MSKIYKNAAKQVFLFDDNNIKLIVSLKESNFSDIEWEIRSDLLDYKDDLKKHNLKVLIPEPVASVHDKFMHKIFEYNNPLIVVGNKRKTYILKR